jgi:hypothetical protein
MKSGGKTFYITTPSLERVDVHASVCTIKLLEYGSQREAASHAARWQQIYRVDTTVTRVKKPPQREKGSKAK